MTAISSGSFAGAGAADAEGGGAAAGGGAGGAAGGEQTLKSKESEVVDETLRLYPDEDEMFLDSEIEDDQLRMMFACCHPSLTPESQVALTLKTLCGFGTAEGGEAL